MNDLVVQGLVTAVVTGALQGWYRVVDARKQAEAAATTQRLGANLGPRVEQLGERMARIEGKVGLPPLDPPTPR